MMEIPEGYYLKGYKIPLYPTDAQKEFIDKCIDVNIYVYNWALEQENIQYGKWKDGESDKRFLTTYDLDKKYTDLRNSTKWLQEIPHNSGRSAIRRVTGAFNKFFKGICNSPKYKSKKKMTKFSFTTRADRMFFEDNMLRIEGLPQNDMIYTEYHTNWKKKENPHFYATVVSRNNLNEYFICFKLLEPLKLDYFESNNIQSMNRAIGIDLNIKDRFVLSTGKVYKAPDISKYEKQLQRLHRKHQKDLNRLLELERTNPNLQNTQLSNRALKRQDRIRKIYHKIHNINENFIQTTTKEIINMNPSSIVMEKLNCRQMKRAKKHIAKLSHYADFYRCREVMKYKAQMYGIEFILADRFYKSSQICSNCGNIHKIGSRKIYKCPKCGLVINRDINAALNLEHLAYTIG